MKHIIAGLILLLSFTSCEKWLNVRPVGDIDADDIINSAEGFQQILNGAYINLASTELYASDLTLGLISSATQEHYQNNNPDKAIYEYNFIGDQRRRIDNMWLKAYNIIVNLNFLLDHIDDRSHLFEANHFASVKSQALALRAYVHFDMLRAFSRNYKGNEGEKAIPYINTYEKAVFPHLEALEVKELIIDDLDEAEALVESKDPLIGRELGVVLDNADLLKHRYRLNYYGILGLKARIYQFTGEPVKATEYAQRVIDESPWRWATEDQLNNGDASDLIMSDECIFMLHVHNMITRVYQNSFTENNYTTSDGRYELGKDIYQVYTGQPGANDLRFQYQFKNDKNGLKAISTKFSGKKTYGGNMAYESMPMIRIGEMYLIVAENNAYTNIDYALSMLNELRQKRKVLPVENITSGELIDEIVKEFRKDTYLEGQVFWMYKRLSLNNIPKLHITDKNTPMVPKNYILPYPEGEIELGNGSRI